MTLLGLVDMALRELNHSRARSMVSGLGIALGVATLLVVVGLGLGIREFVLREVVRELPVDMVEVVPRQLDLGIFKLGAASVLGGTRLDDSAVERLLALDSVQSVYPRLAVDVPLGARGGGRFFERSIYTDILMDGVPAALLAPELGEGWADDTGAVQVVISEQLIEIFNRALAPKLGIPPLTSESLKGLGFELSVGRSVMLGERDAVKQGLEPARIAGASRYAMALGATVPLSTAKRILRDYSGFEGPFRYQSVIVKARSVADVPQIAAAVDELGLDVDDTARRSADVMLAMTWLSGSIGALVLMLAALNIAHSFFASLSERRRELAVFRALGARRSQLIAFVLLQAAVVGLLGAVAGIGLAVVATNVLDGAASKLLPDFPFQPETFFSMPLELTFAGVAAAVVAACAGALWPAWRTARAPVSDALGE